MTNGAHHKVVSMQKPPVKKQPEAEKPRPQQKPGQPQNR
jgi:hypothetical protein